MAHQLTVIIALFFSQLSEVAPPSPPVTAPAQRVLLKRDTPIELMATKEVNTADVKPGTIFKLRVNRPVTIDGVVVIPIGAWVYGEVLAARGSRGLGRSGTLKAKLSYLELGDTKIAVTGDVSTKGAAVTSTVILVALAGWPGFFNRGNDAKIKAGDMVSALIGEDVAFDVAGSVVTRAAP